MYCGRSVLVEKWLSIAENPTLLGADCGNCKRSLKVGRRKDAQPASALNSDNLISRWALGRRTIGTAYRCHSRLVSPRRGITHPRRPVSTRMAGNSVTAARNAIAIETASAGPTLVNAGRRVKTMPQKVTATVAADAAMTLPMEPSAFCTPRSESVPD